MSDRAVKQTHRYQIIDIARGIAIVMMFIYHFSYDLNYFGYIQIDFSQTPFWLYFRNTIVSSFLFVMGISLYLAHYKGIKRTAFLKRFILLVICAGLVSLSSYLMFPNSFIFFGILHFIAVASILGLVLLRFYWFNLVLGIGLIITGLWVEAHFFDHPLWQWFGLMTHKPATEDYVPLIPWLGVVALGIFFACWNKKHNHLPSWSNWHSQAKISRIVALAGRHSLIVYMLHQPLFIGLLFVFTKLTA